MSQEYEFVFKILLVGDSGVGKSSLVTRFISDSFTEKYYNTIGIDFKVRIIELDGKKIKLQLWDTSGDERFQDIITSYYETTCGVIIVYDVTKEESFANVKSKLQDTKEFGGEGVCKILVGNKIDLRKQLVINSSTVEQFANSLGIPLVQTSAMNSMNVELAFVTMAAEIMKGK